MKELISKYTKSRGFIKLLLLIFSVQIVLTTGCAEKEIPSLFDPNATGKPKPVISAIEPAAGGISGVTVITINGQNFSSVLEENTVLFNSNPGTILEASPTRLVVKAANIAPGSDTANIKVRVLGALEFSDTAKYILQQAYLPVFPFKDFEEPSAMEFDNQGNLYISLLANQATNNILKLTPQGVMTKYTPDIGGGLRYSVLRFFNGKLYGFRNQQRAIWEITEGVAAANFLALGTGTTRIIDMDFNQNGFMYAAGNNGTGANFIYRVEMSNKAVATFPFPYSVRAMRVYNNNLYIGVSVDSSARIYKMAIDASNNLATEELFFDFTATYGFNVQINNITFDADGVLYAATNLPDPIIKITQSGQAEALYPGVFEPYPALFFSWDNGQNLYYVRSTVVQGTTIIPQNAFAIRVMKSGAPYYGR